MTATTSPGGRTGRTFADVYGTGKPIPDDEITEWLADAEDYIPKLRGAGHEPMARFLVAAYFIIRQLQDGGGPSPRPAAGTPASTGGAAAD